MTDMEERDLWVQVAAGAVFTDSQSRILFVEPTYQSHWNVPGGAIRQAESPRDGLRREVMEELGIDTRPGPLLCADFHPSTERLRLLFDCGRLTDRGISQISLRQDELKTYVFLTLDDAKDRVLPVVFARLRNSLPLLGTGRTIYLEEGEPPEPSL